MTPSIDTLEKEIEQFHQNIQESNQLMSALIGVSEAIREQTTIFERQADSLEEIAKQLPEDLRRDYIVGLDNFREKVQKENGGQLSQLQDTIHGELGDAVVALNKLLSDYTAANQKAISECNSVLEQKYAGFITQLETTNVSKVYGVCQEINTKLNLKLNIAIGCGVAVVIASILSIVLR